MSYLRNIMREAKTTHERAGQFYADASEAHFLFSKTITTKMEELYSKGLDLVALCEKLYPSDGSPGLPVGDERNQVSKERAELVKWFHKQIIVTKELFKAEMMIKPT